MGIPGQWNGVCPLPCSAPLGDQVNNPIVLSIPQVCELLGCKRSKVFQLLSEGTLERAPRYGREIRIYRESVERALLPVDNSPKRRAKRVLAPPVWNISDISLERGPAVGE